MPITLSAHPERSLAYFRMVGTCSVGEAANSLRSWVATPGFTPAYPMLVNMEDCDAIEATFLAVVFAAERLLPTFRAFTPSGRCIICAPDDVPFGMARMVQQITEPMSNIRFEIYRNPAEALCAAHQPEADFRMLDLALLIETKEAQTA